MLRIRFFKLTSCVAHARWRSGLLGRRSGGRLDRTWGQGCVRRVAGQAPYPHDLSPETASVPGVGGTRRMKHQRPPDQALNQKDPCPAGDSFSTSVTKSYPHTVARAPGTTTHRPEASIHYPSKVVSGSRIPTPARRWRSCTVPRSRHPTRRQKRPTRS